MLSVRFISPPYFAFNKRMQRAQSVLAFVEHVPYPFDSGNEVHADVILGDTCYSAVGRLPGPCIVTFKVSAGELKKQKNPGEELVEVPVSDLPSARAYLNAAATASRNTRYSVSMVDFVLPNAILRYKDPDLDCDAPETWPTLFCSQFALLFLRHCHRHGLITVQQPALRAKALYICNSHVCSPAHLRKILHGVLGPS
jgi:hypothetical protein